MRSGLLAAALLLLAGAACERAPRRPDLILVVIDTWRWDALGANGSPREGITPRLDRLAAGGTRFSRAFAASSWTMPSVASLFTGQLPSIHGAYGRYADVGNISASVRTVAEELHDAGYQTAAIINAPFLSPDFGFARGFDLYDYQPASNHKLRRAEASVQKALDVAAGAPKGKPLFLVLHLFDPHLSYDPPEPWKSRWTGDYKGPLRAPLNPIAAMRAGTFRPSPRDLAFVRALYDAEVAYTDHWLGSFFDRLPKVRPNRPRWVVVTADHGEEFGEHGGFEHGHGMYRETTEVPLLVVPPAKPSRQVVETQVRTLDVMPTLLAAAGLPLPSDISGRSLVSLLDAGGAEGRDRLALSEREHLGPPASALRTGDLSLISWHERPVPELYDQKLDPAEARDVAGERAAQANGLARRLRSIEGALALRAREMGRSKKAIDPKLAEELRSLGYLSP